MDASERPLQPVAIVLHTRDRQDDYRWFPEIGAGQLVGRLKEIHRALIADQDARPAATFVLLDEEARIGLLVANMKTPRQDHLRTHIDDTLLLEFEACDRAAILRITAGLLNTEVGVIQQRLLDYAEAEFRQTQGAARRSAASLTLPVIASVSDADDWPTDRYVALRSNAANRHRIASLLHAAADGREGILRPFILVSTGFVGKERLEQHAGHGQQFVALTRSSNLPENEDLRLEPDGCEKKKRVMQLARRTKVAVATSCIVLLVAWAVRWAVLARTSPNALERPSSQSYASKSSDSKTKSNGSAKRSKNYGERSKKPNEPLTIEAAKGRLAYESARDVSTSEWDGGYTYSTVDDAWELAADPNRQKTAALQLEVADQNLIAEFEWRVLTAESVEFRFDVEPPHPLGITWRLGKEGKSGHLLLDVGDKKQGGSSGEAGVSDLKPYQALRGEWMKIRWMIIDDTVRVEAADVTLTGQHMASGKLKTRIVFAVVGGAAQIRNLKIWEVKIEK